MRSDFSLNTIRKGKTYDVLSIKRETVMVQKYSEKATPLEKQKKEGTKT